MFQNLQEAEAFLSTRKSLGIKPGLERMQKLLQKAGNPEKKIRAVHIAGTNGKGSTVQFINSALQANGYQTGVFTSPSLQGLPGYIYHNNVPVEEDILIELCNQLYPGIKQMDRDGAAPTEFEIITVLALMYFEKNVDLALIETGMGGRLDTTNCLDPLLSIITNVSIDHMQFLGSTISEIAYHKAGIIKRNRPVVIGEMSKDAFREIEKEATDLKAPIYKLVQDFTYIKTGVSKGVQRFIWNEEQPMEISMLGEHQIKNASVAFQAVMLLKKLKYQINIDKTVKAFSRTQLPGRFEMIQEKPAVILDGAHNAKGMEAFIDTILTHYKDRQRHLLFAVFKDKEITEMLKFAVPHFSTVTLTSFDHPRSASLEDLKYFSRKENVFVAENWKEATRSIKDHASVYFVTGSLEFISRVRRYYANKK
ncbi:bifunctional folylpolyglutamate synthase/dihydrofolate synthase [Virgibacillus kimchii]